MEQSQWSGGGLRGQAEGQRAITLHRERAVVGPLCTGAQNVLTLVQTCFLMGVLPPSRDPGQLVTEPGALVAGAVGGGMGLLIGAFCSLRGELKDEMRAGEARGNKHIDEVKVEMKEFKQEISEIKTLLIQALRLPPPAQP